MNEISISGKTYSEIVRQILELYGTSYCQPFKNYMDTRRSECEEDKESISFHVRSISPKKCNKLLTVGK